MNETEKAKAFLNVNILSVKAIKVILGGDISYSEYNKTRKDPENMTFRTRRILAQKYDMLANIYGESFITKAHLS